MLTSQGKESFWKIKCSGFTSPAKSDQFIRFFHLNVFH
jgi:hypothetical protein